MCLSIFTICLDNFNLVLYLNITKVCHTHPVFIYNQIRISACQDFKSLSLKMASPHLPWQDELHLQWAEATDPWQETQWTAASHGAQHSFGYSFQFLNPLYELLLLYPQRTPWWYCKYSYHSTDRTKAQTLPLPRVAWVNISFIKGLTPVLYLIHSS